MDTPWLDKEQLAAWVRLVAVVELLPRLLDSQLRRDEGLTYFEYHVLAMLSEAPRRTMRMSELGLHANATLARLSNVVRRLEERGLVERSPSSKDRRVINARLTTTGWQKVRRAAPEHVATVREHVLDPLTRKQVAQLTTITDAILEKLDPDGRGAAIYQRYDQPHPQATARCLAPRRDA